MAKTKLFESWSFRMTPPAPFDDPKYSGPQTVAVSAYNSAGTIHKATLHAPSMRAIMAYCNLLDATDKGDPTDGLGAIGQQGNNYRIAEYHANGKTDCVVFNPLTGKFIVGRFDDGSTTPRPYNLVAGGASGTALIFALMPILDDDTEFHDHLAQFKLQMITGFSDMDAAFATALTLCDNIYRRIENCLQVGNAGVKITIPGTGNVQRLAQMAIDNGSYAPTGTLYGNFTILKPNGSVPQPTRDYAKEDLVAKYVMTPRTLSAREEAMVPQLPDWYIIPPEVVLACEHLRDTTKSAQPIRDILFRGEAGAGKTEAVKAIAAGLHLPYVLVTCNGNTEISDLVGQFVPKAEGNISMGNPNLEKMPKFSDISMHPPSVYEMLTGEYDESKTEDDVLQKLVEISVSRLAQKSGVKQEIAYVDSPLVEAIRYGYVCELQEPSGITNPAVLLGLNSLLDTCQTITLPTGERIHRHPDTVIIATTNKDYAGCKDMNQSVTSRFLLKFDVKAPTLPTKVKRVMSITGSSDEQLVTKMALVVEDMAERCHQSMIQDGSIGMRELIAWAQSTLITKDPYRSAMITVIPSATQDDDNQADLITTCLEKQFSATF